MQQHWDRTRDFIKAEWPKISEAALRKINGDYDLFLKYLKESYGNFPLEEANARNKIQNFLNTLS